jgi:hypothetical protein
MVAGEARGIGPIRTNAARREKDKDRYGYYQECLLSSSLFREPRLLSTLWQCLHTGNAQSQSPRGKQSIQPKNLRLIPGSVYSFGGGVNFHRFATSIKIAGC